MILGVLEYHQINIRTVYSPGKHYRQTGITFLTVGKIGLWYARLPGTTDPETRDAHFPNSVLVFHVFN